MGIDYSGGVAFGLSVDPDEIGKLPWCENYEEDYECDYPDDWWKSVREKTDPKEFPFELHFWGDAMCGETGMIIGVKKTHTSTSEYATKCAKGIDVGKTKEYEKVMKAFIKRFKIKTKNKPEWTVYSSVS